MKRLCIVSLFFIFTFALFASPYDLILVGDPVLEDLRFLSLESGQPFLSFTPPFSPQEVEQFLFTLDTSLLSGPAQEAYNRVRERLSPSAPLSFLSSENFLLTINLLATMEARVNSNNEVSWYPDNPRVPPYLSAPIRFFFSDSIMFYIEPSLKIRTANYVDFTNTFDTNVSFNIEKIDSHMPFRAFMAAGGSWWNFQLGRDRLSFGTGRMGNMAVSDNPDFYEFMRFSFFSRNVKYTSLTVQMPLEINDSLVDFDRFPFDSLPADTLKNTTNRYFYLHRLDFNLFDKFSLGLMEGVMVGNSPLELRFLNPIMLFHNFFGWYDYEDWDKTPGSNWGNNVGSLFSLEANWNIIPSLAVYGQFVMNEWATSGERRDNPKQPPNGTGFMLGIQYSHSFNSWASTFFFEFTSTDPFLYYNPSPFASFIHMRKTQEPFYTLMGYPRDLIIFTLGGNFFKGDEFSISAIFSLLFNGARDIYYDWDINPENVNERNPSGTVEEKFIASFDARWKINNLFTLNGSLTGIYSRNNNNEPGNEAGLQAALSLTFSY